MALVKCRQGWYCIDLARHVRVFPVMFSAPYWLNSKIRPIEAGGECLTLLCYVTLIARQFEGIAAQSSDTRLTIFREATVPVLSLHTPRVTGRCPICMKFHTLIILFGGRVTVQHAYITLYYVAYEASLTP